jgi:hypothetical protein
MTMPPSRARSVNEAFEVKIDQTGLPVLHPAWLTEPVNEGVLDSAMPSMMPEGGFPEWLTQNIDRMTGKLPLTQPRPDLYGERLPQQKEESQIAEKLPDESYYDFFVRTGSWGPTGELFTPGLSAKGKADYYEGFLTAPREITKTISHPFLLTPEEVARNRAGQGLPSRDETYERIPKETRLFLEIGTEMALGAALYATGHVVSEKLTSKEFVQIEKKALGEVLVRVLPKKLIQWQMLQARQSRERPESTHPLYLKFESLFKSKSDLARFNDFVTQAWKEHRAKELAAHRQATGKAPTVEQQAEIDAAAAEKTSNDAVLYLSKFTETNTGVPGQTVSLAEIQSGIKMRLPADRQEAISRLAEIAVPDDVRRWERDPNEVTRYLDYTIKNSVLLKAYRKMHPVGGESVPLTPDARKAIEDNWNARLEEVKAERNLPTQMAADFLKRQGVPVPDSWKQFEKDMAADDRARETEETAIAASYAEESGTPSPQIQSVMPGTGVSSQGTLMDTSAPKVEPTQAEKDWDALQSAATKPIEGQPSLPTVDYSRMTDTDLSTLPNPPPEALAEMQKRVDSHREAEPPTLRQIANELRELESRRDALQQYFASTEWDAVQPFIMLASKYPRFADREGSVPRTLVDKLGISGQMNPEADPKRNYPLKKDGTFDLTRIKYDAVITGALTRFIDMGVLRKGEHNETDAHNLIERGIENRRLFSGTEAHQPITAQQAADRLSFTGGLDPRASLAQSINRLAKELAEEESRIHAIPAKKITDEYRVGRAKVDEIKARLIAGETPDEIKLQLAAVKAIETGNVTEDPLIIGEIKKAADVVQKTETDAKVEAAITSPDVIGETKKIIEAAQKEVDRLLDKVLEYPPESPESDAIQLQINELGARIDELTNMVKELEQSGQPQPVEAPRVEETEKPTSSVPAEKPAAPVKKAKVVLTEAELEQRRLDHEMKVLEAKLARRQAAEARRAAREKEAEEARALRAKEREEARKAKALTQQSPGGVVPPPPLPPTATAASPAPRTPQDIVLDLAKFLKAHKSELDAVRMQQEGQRSAERMRRTAAMEYILQHPKPGETWGELIARASKALGGEYYKAKWDGALKEFGALQDDMYRIVATSKNFYGDGKPVGAFHRIQGKDALDRILGNGKWAGRPSAPTGYDAKLLSRFFGRMATSALYNEIDLAKLLFEVAAQVANTSRTMLTVGDISHTLRQNLILMISNPRDFPTYFTKALGAMFSEGKFEEIDYAYRQTPEYLIATSEAMGNDKLDMPNINGTFTEREEAYIAKWLEGVPGIGKIVRGSERYAYTLMNLSRLAMFKKITDSWNNDKAAPLSGEPGAKTMEDFKMLARFINAASGRGNIPQSLRGFLPTFNFFSFAPRYYYSLLELPGYLLPQARVVLTGKTNPVTGRTDYTPRIDMSKDSPTVRRLAWAAIAATLSVQILITMLLSLMGADVELDMRSTDFGKSKFGNTRIDIWRGLQQPLVLAARLLTGQTKDRYGRVTPLRSRQEALERFFESKETPIISQIRQIIDGKNFVGEETARGAEGWTKFLLENYVPLAWQDTRDAMEDSGLFGAILIGLLALSGVGINTYGNEAPFRFFDTEQPELPPLRVNPTRTPDRPTPNRPPRFGQLPVSREKEPAWLKG